MKTSVAALVQALVFVLTLVSVPIVESFGVTPVVSSTRTTTTTTSLDAATIQFVKGLDETVIPNIKLTRAKDGSSGVATFVFASPNVFDASTQARGEITGMFLTDEEGELSTTEVNASFTNGKPQSIEAIYVMKTPDAWDRFMRFMDRYGEENGLGFRKA